MLVEHVTLGADHPMEDRNAIEHSNREGQSPLVNEMGVLEGQSRKQFRLLM